MPNLNRPMCTLILLLSLPAAAIADRIAVVGTGSVGGALGPEFAELGHDIVYGSRNPSRDDVQALVKRTSGNSSATTPAESIIGADIIVLAVPGALAAEITAGLGDLSGKVIIDPTNHITRDDGVPSMVTKPSVAEAIQAAAPDAMVVKAFNTLNWQQMVDPDSSGGPVSIPLVGDDADAKAKVAALVEGLGLEAIDLGPLSYAGHVEGMLVVWMNARMSGHPYDYHLRQKSPQ